MQVVAMMERQGLECVMRKIQKVDDPLQSLSNISVHPSIPIGDSSRAYSNSNGWALKKEREDSLSFIKGNNGFWKFREASHGFWNGCWRFLCGFWEVVIGVPR